MTKILTAFITGLALATIVTAGAEEAPAGNDKNSGFRRRLLWCIQPAFDKTPGVIKTIVGYCGGTEPNPTYELVTSEKTKYRESIEVTYDPQKVSYDRLVEFSGRKSTRLKRMVSLRILGRAIVQQFSTETKTRRRQLTFQRPNLRSPENSRSRS